jgi:hypothetical protein
MTKVFKVTGEITREVSAEIEADSKAEAMEKFVDRRCDYQESFVSAIEVNQAIEVGGDQA